MTLATTKRSEIIRRFLLGGVKAKNNHVILDAAEAFGISRQAVHAHLSALIKQGYLVAVGNTKGRTYQLGVNRSESGVFALKDLQESDVYYRDFGSIFIDLPREIENICHYGFTEMLNNAIDHSLGTTVFISVERSAEKIAITIMDDGEGIFNHIARLKSLRDPRESILELSKGKLTTDPDNHTGQGIFFTSRAFDEFFIVSGDLAFSHVEEYENDFLLHREKDQKGTKIYMEIYLNTDRVLKAIFDEYTGSEDQDYAFNKTVVPVKLALYEGGRLISRSQAKRILNRVEQFETVLLDFKGVDMIGQAFADEVFRVFAKRNPQILIHAIHQNADVEKMIKAAKAGE
jgi:anti-sigma regulatory factor (Ser/Thr protein kinase)